jgi:plasmid stability protein
MTDVLIRGVSDEVLERLKRRAAANNRSLQGELKEILTTSARREPLPEVDAVELARRVKEKIAARHGGPFETDSADLIRDDRDTR